MKRRTTRKPAFTLIELLISSVIFIVIALLATGTLVSTVRMQTSQKQNQNISLQAQSVLDAIKFDVESSGNNTLRTFQFTGTKNYTTTSTSLYPSATPDDSALIIVVPLRDQNGSVIAGGGTETHVYCAELQNIDNNARTFTGKRIVRYVINSTYTYDASFAQAALTKICSTLFIQSAFSLTSLPSDGVQYLTDPYFEVVNLRFWSVWSYGWSSPSAPSPSLYDVNPDGIRTELTALYSVTNGASNIETRVSDINYSSPPFVFRSLVGRNKGYMINN